MASYEKTLPADNTELITNTEADKIITESFNIEEHLSVIRSNRHKRQTPKQDRYVLFVLDASGSITQPKFEDVKEVVANLSILFCEAKVAVMSYNGSVRNEFCFNCHTYDKFYGYSRREAVKSIKYPKGLTATGNALRGACNYMLNTPCGFPRNEWRNPPLVDVIVLTDGHRTAGEDTCVAAKCLSKIPNMKVLPIGIGDYDHDELLCIRGANGASNSEPLLELENFEQLKEVTRQAIAASSTKLCTS